MWCKPIILQSAEEIQILEERIMYIKFRFPEGAWNSSVELSGANQQSKRQDKMASRPRLTTIIIMSLKKATVGVITA